MKKSLSTMTVVPCRCPQCSGISVSCTMKTTRSSSQFWSKPGAFRPPQRFCRTIPARIGSPQMAQNLLTGQGLSTMTCSIRSCKKQLSYGDSESTKIFCISLTGRSGKRAAAAATSLCPFAKSPIQWKHMPGNTEHAAVLPQQLYRRPFYGQRFSRHQTSPAGRTIPACGFFIYKTTDPEDLLCFLLTILPMTIVNSN